MGTKFDVIVVGSGASGAVCCDVLSAKGLAVCCIERGDWLDTKKTPSNFIAWESHKSRSHSFNPNKRRAASDYFIDVSDSPIDVANFNGVGGATVLYSGHYPRFHQSDFKTFSLDGVGCDWPISYEELAPFYEANERFLGVAGLPGDPAYPDLMGHLETPLPLGSAGARLAEAFNRLGWHWWPSYSAIVQKRQGQRDGCAMEGPCNTGCFNGAKGSADVTFMRKALTQGLELRVNTIVSELIISDGQVRGVRTKRNDGVVEEIAANKVVLAANAIGTCRLLWNQRLGDYIGNSSGQIGLNFMMHPLGYVEGILPGEQDACFGPQGSWLASHEFYETDPDRDFKRGYSMHLLKGAGPAEIFYQQSFLNPHFLGRKDLLCTVRKMVRNKVAIGIICEDFPEDGNSIEMTSVIDKDGLPIPKIRYALTKNTKRMMSHGMVRAKKLLKEAGCESIVASGPIRFAGWHLTGTTRMGPDRRHCVVDTDGQMHDISNLYIVDGGLFPSSSGVNPTATIQAIARYLSEKISNDCR
ncbi:GMC family oxidoreductase [Litoricolaceae bacterium]|nr:GMC family oxidoreductase [Litorivicinaceae bacterium]